MRDSSLAFLGIPHTVHSPQSINRLIGSQYGSGNNASGNPWYTSWESGTIQMNLPSLYLRCASFSSTQDPSGRTDIIKRIATSNENYYGTLIYDSSDTIGERDIIDVSGMTLKNLHFRLTNLDNVPYTLAGGNLIFSLVFWKEKSDE